MWSSDNKGNLYRRNNWSSQFILVEGRVVSNWLEEMSDFEMVWKEGGNTCVNKGQSDGRLTVRSETKSIFLRGINQQHGMEVQIEWDELRVACSVSELPRHRLTYCSEQDRHCCVNEGPDAKIHLKNVNLVKIRYLKGLKYRIPLLLPLFESLDEKEDGERTLPDRSTRSQGRWHLCCWLALLSWVRFQPEHTR